ncbi:MAG: hypothetical protein J4F28_02050 [Nitrosopumilaceae archaeon]|nr:hypothetical protein [Nitrosopumilaceae archaeon]
MPPTEPNATRTIFRCSYCNVMLGAPVDLPAGIALAVACGTCISLLNRWVEDIEFREHRRCKCTHTLDDHKYIDTDSGAPSPCEEETEDEQECPCKNFVEDYN